MTGRAVFLDRDGTLVHPRHYPARPEELVLFDGIGPGLRILQDAGFLLIVITNQSGIARGLFTEADLERMHRHLRDELGRLSVCLGGIYYCPHHEEGSIPALSFSCDCRKPQPGMLLRAAAEHGINLSRSWLAGDILDDVEAGNRAGCRTVLVDLGTEAAPTTALRRPGFVARDTVHALQIIATVEGIASPSELTYRPAGWRRGAEMAAAGVAHGAID
jgi:D-glycero-D-manno-heptose 1,7-bisphosphate phosphatase